MENYPSKEIEKIDLLKHNIHLELIDMIPERLARKHIIVPLDIDKQFIQVAMVNPGDFVALKDIEVLTQKKVIPCKSSCAEIMQMIDRLYASSNALKKRKALEKQVKLDSQEQTGQVACLEWLESLMEEAIAIEVSDIHIEPRAEKVKVRYRIDGELQERHQIDKEVFPSLITCIKIMANLDISEKRLPQDGRINRIIKKKKVEFRVNSLPTFFGEKIMLRVIRQEENRLMLEELGFQHKDLNVIQRLIRCPKGLIIFTGPTGCGKSTSLASVLERLNDSTKNIITVEDPIETIIEGINQVSINEKTGLTFPKVLKAMLRQDPDILMVGEMRDTETAQIAARAALTGHLVLSTLHTGDAISSIMRLIDMGVEDYIVGSTVKAVISQRLVRRICPYCKQEHNVTLEEEKHYHIKQGTILYKGIGCIACNGTGYKGRKAVYEIFNVENELEELLNIKRLNIESLRQIAKKRGMRTLRENLYEDVIAGYTSLEEAIHLMYE